MSNLGGRISRVTVNGERSFRVVGVSCGSRCTSVNVSSAITKVPGESERRSTTRSSTCKRDRGADSTRGRTSDTIGKRSTVDRDS